MPEDVDDTIETLRGLVGLSRRVCAGAHEDDLYGILARDIGRLMAAQGCVIASISHDTNRDTSTRVITPMLPSFGIADVQSRSHAVRLDPGTAMWRLIFDGETIRGDAFEFESGADVAEFFGRGNASETIIVAMRVHSETLGLVMLTGRDAGFADRDLRRAEAYASEAALALENARLFEEEHHVASALQHALLPGPMPTVPGLDVAALYRPAGPSGSVGGDFYDVFDMGDDRYGLLLGDVSGKGPEAAAQTALVRHMTRGLLVREHLPGPVVAELNCAIWRQNAPEEFVTLLFGIYDAATRAITWANAGHPRPLFRTRGQPAHPFGATGRALGILEETDVRIERMRLSAGDVLVWYTDGLSEARRPGGSLLGEEELLRTFEANAERDASEIAEALYRRAIAHGGRLGDDVAMLVIRCHG